jgi:nucleotide-binding universal stress UspA family protein
MFEKVLVCLDGSALAEVILPYIAGESGSLSKIVLLQVVAPPGINLPLGVPGETIGTIRSNAAMSRFQKELEEATPYLESKAQPLREQGLDVECVVLEGAASQAITEYARDNEISMIAVATHGYTGLRHITLGSTAEYILKHSGLPVLMVTPFKHD